MFKRCVLYAVVGGLTHSAHGQCNNPGAEACCEQHLSVGCNDLDCCALVCQSVPYCCELFWDIGCVAAAQQMCDGGCQCGLIGSCCTSHSFPHCNNASCCTAVCAELPHCCETQWDEACVMMAQVLCTDLPECQPPSCSEPFPAQPSMQAGPCCTIHATPFCNNPACCTTVCKLDPFCCEIQWDHNCIVLAAQNCSGLSNCDPNSCLGHCGGQAPGGCWCDELCFAYYDCCGNACFQCPELGGCQPEVATCQGFCGGHNVNGCLCSHPKCVDTLGPCGGCAAGDECHACPEPETCQDVPYCIGNCGGQSPLGCFCDASCFTFADCCQDVCESCGCNGSKPVWTLMSCENLCGAHGFRTGCFCDSLCCNFNDCCDDYEAVCGAECPPPFCRWDVNRDHVVDGGDLGVLLLAYGPCVRDNGSDSRGTACPTDFDQSGTTDGADLGQLLLNFGVCSP